MTETRTKNSVYKTNNEGDNTYFGKKQMEAIQSAFKSNHQVKMWCFASQMPLLFMKKKITELANKIHSGKKHLGSVILQFALNRHRQCV